MEVLVVVVDEVATVAFVVTLVRAPVELEVLVVTGEVAFVVATVVGVPGTLRSES